MSPSAGVRRKHSDAEVIADLVGARQGVGRGPQLAYLAGELGGDLGQLGPRGPDQSSRWSTACTGSA
jgi:hypothetical protein